ncbi:MAG: putative cardiolipin synthase [Planctomycetota bacterium]|jgi:putative cardiolipin synthase
MKQVFCLWVMRSALLVLSLGCAATAKIGDFPRDASFALERGDGTLLGEAARSGGWVQASGFALLDRGSDALDVRLAMIDTAEESIDVQTYLWHGDRTGHLLLEKALRAADRGVRVRILIDGFEVEGGFEAAAALAWHPNVSMRAFNPYLEEGAAAHVLELLEDFGRLDHRMHDKLIVADGVLAVAGGRNLGDEYLGLGEVFDFRDFDLAVAGPVVDELERDFDEFWNSDYSVPVGDLASGNAASEVRHHARRSRLVADMDEHPVLLRRRATEGEHWRPALGRLFGHMHPGKGRVVRDVLYSSKGGLEGGGTRLMAQEFEALQVDAGEEMWFVTAYLVPDQAFVDHLRREVERGVRVRILTNSLASTNVPMVHAVYSNWRRPLIEAGVELHELRIDSAARSVYQSPGSRATRLGLHAKASLFGDDTVLVGSMNLDPRSMRLNTELGIVVESRALAAELRRAMERDFSPTGSWRVKLDPDGNLRWVAGDRVLTRQPALGPMQRATTWFWSFWPIDGEV